MDPIRASHLLSELFTRLDIDGPKFAMIAGLPRPTVARMLDGSTKWNSRKAVVRAGAPLGMGDNEGRDFLRFLSGDLPMAEAIRRALPVLEQSKAALEERAKLASRVGAAVKRFEQQMDSETNAGLREFATQELWEMHGGAATEAQVRATVARLQEAMTQARRHHVMPPHPPSSTARIGGSDRPRRGK